MKQPLETKRKDCQSCRSLPYLRYSKSSQSAGHQNILPARQSPPQIFNQSVTQSVTKIFIQSITHSLTLIFNQSVSQSPIYSTSQSATHQNIHPANYSLTQIFTQSVSQSPKYSPSVSQSPIYSPSQSSSHLYIYKACQPVSHPVTQAYSSHSQSLVPLHTPFHPFFPFIHSGSYPVLQSTNSQPVTHSQRQLTHQLVNQPVNVASSNQRFSHLTSLPVNQTPSLLPHQLTCHPNTKPRTSLAHQQTSTSATQPASKSLCHPPSQSLSQLCPESLRQSSRHLYTHSPTQ